jgi:creatinine amidohydrolase
MNLADLEPASAWAAASWTDFAAGRGKPERLALLPLFGFADWGLGLPLDFEEVLGSALLRKASAKLATGQLTILSPLRFGLVPYQHGLWGVDIETALRLLAELASGVKEAGFAKLGFFATSPWNQELIDTAARDARVGLGLQTFCVNLTGLGLSLHPGRSETRPDLQAIGSYLLGIAPESASRPGHASLTHFRPGRFDQPGPVDCVESAPDRHQRGQSALDRAAERLAALLAEIVTKSPLPDGGKVPLMS